MSELRYGGTDVGVISAMSIGSVDDSELVYMHSLLALETAPTSQCRGCIAG